MKRTDRMLALILELQANGWQRAEDLAERFGVSRRTIYRDMTAMIVSGVPVVSEPGRGFSLVEGYFLPPLHLTEDEAILMLLGADYVAQAFDEQYEQTAKNAMQKIRLVLPPHVEDRADELLHCFRFVATQPYRQTTAGDTLRTLRRAIVESQTVNITYYSRPLVHSDAAYTERDIDPYALAFVNRVWYIVAYCHLRNDLRHFRLDRIDDIKLLPSRFERPVGFVAEGPTLGNNPETVRLLFKHEVARWVEEDMPYNTTSLEYTPDGMLLSVKVRRVEDILQWVLGWGSRVRVLEPEHLRQRVFKEAETILINC
ncbi:MAG: YafY family transcriptional regulator [Chloroflexi bacterium]|nr:YafY family transcriptional regulator [Chloroflexota bacterium]